MRPFYRKGLEATIKILASRFVAPSPPQHPKRLSASPPQSRATDLPYLHAYLLSASVRLVLKSIPGKPGFDVAQPFLPDKLGSTRMARATRGQRAVRAGRPQERRQSEHSSPAPHPGRKRLPEVRETCVRSGDLEWHRQRPQRLLRQAT